MVILKILAYIISILLVLYGLFGKVLIGYSDFLPEASEELRRILYKILVVVWRIGFTASGVALFILVKRYSELSQIQHEILVAIVLNPLLIFIAVGVGFAVIGVLWMILMLLGGGLCIFFHEVLCPYLFEPLFNKLGWLFDKIGLTSKLEEWENKARERRIEKRLKKRQKTSYQNE
jgi:hypothetical protein